MVFSNEQVAFRLEQRGLDADNRYRCNRDSLKKKKKKKQELTHFCQSITHRSLWLLFDLRTCIIKLICVVDEPWPNFVIHSFAPNTWRSYDLLMSLARLPAVYGRNARVEQRVRENNNTATLFCIIGYMGFWAMIPFLLIILRICVLVWIKELKKEGKKERCEGGRYSKTSKTYSGEETSLWN